MQKKFIKDFSKSYYKGLKGIYFYKILDTIIQIGNLRKRNVKILDFGCGIGEFKKLLPDKVLGYDTMPEFTEISDWKKANFDTMVSNEVFYTFSKEELVNFLDELYKYNPKCELIVGISKQRFLNKILCILADQMDAYADTKLKPREEISILKQRMYVIKKINVFFMCDVYLLRFKKLD